MAYLIKLGYFLHIHNNQNPYYGFLMPRSRRDFSIMSTRFDVETLKNNNLIWNIRHSEWVLNPPLA